MWGYCRCCPLYSDLKRVAFHESLEARGLNGPRGHGDSRAQSIRINRALYDRNRHTGNNHGNEQNDGQFDHAEAVGEPGRLRPSRPSQADWAFIA
jgi:hypothetical protein